MTESHTLTQFLQETGAELRIYDMGRRVVEIPVEEFLSFEQNVIPYPLPLQNQAWFGISMLDREVSSEPLIWFLRLPLDEQGKLVLASRDYFMQRLLEVAVARQQDTVSEVDAFKDNPYIFKPREERLAIFHAKLARDLQLAHSRFYDHALDYFNGKPGWEQWSFVGYQGIADIAAVCGEEPIAGTLTAAIPQLPDQPLIALCHCLENEPLNGSMARALLDRLGNQLSMESPSIKLASALVRSLALCKSRPTREALLETLFASRLATNIEILAAISGRAWELLESPYWARLFMEALAENDHGQEAFNNCVADLMTIPGMRQPILESMRSPERSEKLGIAFARFMEQLQ